MINYLQYSGYFGGDRGALYAFEHKEGDCTEYSDLFIALCRAKGIPANFIEGVVYNSGATEREQIVHNWAEIFIPEYGWIPVDATWGEDGKDYYGNMDNQHIIISKGRCLPSLEGYHYYYFYYYYEGEEPEISHEDSFKIVEVTSLPTTPPTTTPAPTTTSVPKHITLTGGMDEPLSDGKLYVVAWTVTKSYRGWQPGGYFVEVFIQNLTKDEILWKPKVMKVVDSSGKSHNCRVDVSFILTGTEEELSVIEQIFGPDEGFRLWLNFETGMYLPETFILTNEYSDGSTTTWEIRLEL